MNSYSCPALNPSLCQLFQPSILVLCFSSPAFSPVTLSLSFLAYCPPSQMAADLGDVLLHTSHMELLRWAERLLIPPLYPLPTWLAGAKPKPRSGPRGGHVPLSGWAGTPAPGGWNTHTCRLTISNSHPLHRRCGVRTVSERSHVASCHIVKCQLTMLIYPHWLYHSIRIHGT